jgi:hypothetical protein
MLPTVFREPPEQPDLRRRGMDLRSHSLRQRHVAFWRSWRLRGRPPALFAATAWHELARWPTPLLCCTGHHGPWWGARPNHWPSFAQVNWVTCPILARPGPPANRRLRRLLEGKRTRYVQRVFRNSPLANQHCRHFDERRGHCQSARTDHGAPCPTKRPTRFLASHLSN